MTKPKTNKSKTKLVLNRPSSTLIVGRKKYQHGEPCDDLPDDLLELMKERGEAIPAPESE